jgi:hypothetical protein
MSATLRAKDSTMGAAFVTGAAAILAAILVVVLPLLISHVTRGENKSATAPNSSEINRSHVEIRAEPGADQHAVVGTSVNNSYFLLEQPKAESSDGKSRTVAAAPAHSAPRTTKILARQIACTQKQSRKAAEALEQLHKPIAAAELDELHRR